MQGDTRDLIWAHAAGLLDDDERDRAQKLVEGAPELQSELERVRRLMGALATESAAPSQSLRDRLFAEVSGPRRFDPMLDRLAGLLDLSEPDVRSALATIDDAAAWKPAVLPGLTQVMLKTGPKAGAVRACWLKLPGGYDFPNHRHGGEERVMVIQGSYFDHHKQQRVLPGDVSIQGVGSSHAFKVDAHEECIALVMVTGPIEIVK